MKDASQTTVNAVSRFPLRKWLMVMAVLLGVTGFYSCGGDDDHGVTPEPEVVIHVDKVTLNVASVNLEEGATQTLSVTISPANAWYKEVSWTTSNAAVATVDQNGKVTAVAPGEATITVTAKDGNKAVSCKVTVTKKENPVKINADEQEAATFEVGEDIQLKVTVEGSDAANVTFTSSDPTIATVDENGKVTAVGTGEVTITVTTEDGQSATFVLNVQAKSEPEVISVTGIELSESSLELTEGEGVTLSATVSPEDATNKNYTWSSSDPEVATVADGAVTALKEGSATITVTTEDGEFTASCVITVKAKEPEVVKVTGVSLSETSIEIEVEGAASLTATVSPENATNKKLTWSSSNPEIATVADGAVTGIKEGSASITVTTEDGEFTASCAVTVKAKTVKVTGVTLSSGSLSLEVGGSATLSAIVSPDNATNKKVTWSSSNPSVANVSDGVVTAVAEGSATITVTTEDGEFSASCSVTVEDNTPPVISVSVTGVTLSAPSLEVQIGHTATLTATVAPDDATDKSVTWTSSDPAIATVENGVVTGVAIGECIITVKTVDGNFEATCAVEVIASTGGTDPLSGGGSW